MDWLELLNDIFKVCIIPLLGILSTYLIKFIKLQGDAVIESIENEKARKYLRMLQNTITEAVVETNQTYVENMKDKQMFDEEAQKIAFTMTYQRVLSLINEESKVYLANIVGDLNEYITTLIEAEVNRNKY